MPEETTGGSSGCDVCGILVDAAKTAVHAEWHRADDERFERLAAALRDLAGALRVDRT